jgi:SAM-dependent methyltransferase
LRRGILNEFVSQITFPKEAKVLEIGCGTGAVTRFLAGLPDVSHAVGVDPSPVFIAKAKELAGSVQNLVSVASLPSSIEYIRTGKLRGLAVTSAIRAEALPDVPSVGEFVTGYEVSAWYGVGAPKGTPVDVIDKLNEEINAGLADRKLKARLADFGGTVFALSPADFGKFIADETEKWAKWSGRSTSRRVKPDCPHGRHSIMHRCAKIAGTQPSRRGWCRKPAPMAVVGRLCCKSILPV